MIKEIDINDLIDKIATLKTEQADIKELVRLYYDDVYGDMTGMTLEELQEIATDLGILEDVTRLKGIV